MQLHMGKKGAESKGRLKVGLPYFPGEPSIFLPAQGAIPSESNRSPLCSYRAALNGERDYQACAAKEIMLESMERVDAKAAPQK